MRYLSYPLLLSACLLTNPSAQGQEPLGAPAVDSTPQTAPEEGSQAIRDWRKLDRLVGGEWHTSEDFFKASFHRFLPGQGGTSLYVVTRDREELDSPPSGPNVIFYDPKIDAVRGIAVASNGATFDNRFRWRGETLINQMSYHIADGSMQDGKLVERTFDLEGHWKFSDEGGYDWEMFQKSAEGVQRVMGTSFHHKDELTELPPIKPVESKPLEQLSVLAPFDAELHAQDTAWTCQGEWRAGGRALWVERTIPDAFGEDSMTVEGFFYWNPFATQTEFVGFSQRGDLITGEVETKSPKQFNVGYTVTPALGKENKPAPEETWVRLGEQVTALDTGNVNVAWVVKPAEGEGRVIEAALEPK